MLFKLAAGRVHDFAKENIVWSDTPYDRREDSFVSTLSMRCDAVELEDEKLTETMMRGTSTQYVDRNICDELTEQDNADVISLPRFIACTR